MRTVAGEPFCDFQRLADTHEPGEPPVTATVFVTVTFDSGTSDTFKLCDACARDHEQHSRRDPRIVSTSIVRRL